MTPYGHSRGVKIVGHSSVNRIKDLVLKHDQRHQRNPHIILKKAWEVGNSTKHFRKIYRVVFIQSKSFHRSIFFSIPKVYSLDKTEKLFPRQSIENVHQTILLAQYGENSSSLWMSLQHTVVSSHISRPVKKRLVYEPLYETCTNRIRIYDFLYGRYTAPCTVRVYINRIPFIYGFRIWLRMHMKGIPIAAPCKDFVHTYTKNKHRRTWFIYRSLTYRNETVYGTVYGDVYCSYLYEQKPYTDRIRSV